MSQEDFEELAGKAPTNVQLEFLDGRLYVKGDHIEVEDFEELARKAPEGIKLELIDGKLEVKPLPDQRHRAIVMWLMVEALQQRPECRLYPEQGLKIGAYRKGNACADAALRLSITSSPRKATGRLRRASSGRRSHLPRP
jgi:hypothetical protein